MYEKQGLPEVHKTMNEEEWIFINIMILEFLHELPQYIANI